MLLVHKWERNNLTNVNQCVKRFPEFKIYWNQDWTVKSVKKKRFLDGGRAIRDLVCCVSMSIWAKILGVQVYCIVDTDSTKKFHFAETHFYWTVNDTVKHEHNKKN